MINKFSQLFVEKVFDYHQENYEPKKSIEQIFHLFPNNKDLLELLQSSMENIFKKDKNFPQEKVQEINQQMSQQWLSYWKSNHIEHDDLITIHKYFRSLDKSTQATLEMKMLMDLTNVESLAEKKILSNNC